MSTEGKGKFTTHPQSQHGRISVPASVVSDSTFPFEDGDPVRVCIGVDHIVIWKVE